MTSFTLGGKQYPPRSICPGCGVYYQRKKDGSLRPHKAWVFDEWTWCPQTKTGWTGTALLEREFLKSNRKEAMQRKVPDGYKVWIDHYRGTSDELGELDQRTRPDREDFPIQAITRARIVEVTDAAQPGADVEPIIVAEGWSYCSVSDQFDKRKGRLIATGRALKALEQDEV